MSDATQKWLLIGSDRKKVVSRKVTRLSDRKSNSGWNSWGSPNYKNKHMTKDRMGEELNAFHKKKQQITLFIPHERTKPVLLYLKVFFIYHLGLEISLVDVCVEHSINIWKHFPHKILRLWSLIFSVSRIIQLEIIPMSNKMLDSGLSCWRLFETRTQRTLISKPNRAADYFENYFFFGCRSFTSAFSPERSSVDETEHKQTRISQSLYCVPFFPYSHSPHLWIIHLQSNVN